MIHEVIQMECDMYHSIWIVKDVNVMDELIKSHNVDLLNMMMYTKYTVLKYMPEQWPCQN